MGMQGWREDFAAAFRTAASIPPQFRSGSFWIIYLYAIPNGVLISDDQVNSEIARIASAAERFGEQIAVDMARTAHGVTLIHRRGPARDVGLKLLEETRDAGRENRYTIPGNLPVADIHIARERARRGDCDGAIELVREVLHSYLRRGEFMWLGLATATLVESLLQRGRQADVTEARDAVATLAAVPAEPGVVLNEIWLLRLRALVARADGDEVAYVEYRDRYRTTAIDLDFEGHMAWSAAMM
jgi:adenylate cyclase